MAILLGLGAAAAWGVADFFGGFASRWVRATLAVVISQAIGLASLLLLLPLFRHETMTSGAVLWGALAGMAGGFGLLNLYRGLGRGRMAVVAPVSAVIGAVVPVAFDLAIGDPVGALTLAGVVIALAALALVSWHPGVEGRADGDSLLRSGLPEGLLAGLGFGTFFVLFAQAGDASTYWPLLSLRVASVLMLSAIALATGSFARPGRRALGILVAAGVLDVTANLLYLLGTQRGLLSVVAVLAALYPAATVLMARAILKERLHRTQVLGLAAAGLGIVLITAG
ncbi:MAG TPA: DMT family transporter [Actinomycetota bacterium]